MPEEKRYTLKDIQGLSDRALRDLCNSLVIGATRGETRAEREARVKNKLKELERLDTDGAVEETEEEGDNEGTVSVSYVRFKEDLSGFVGKTVREVAESLADEWGINMSESLKYYVNGDEVDSDYKLSDGDELNMGRALGEKGG